jgi:hypothetical protein
MSDLLKEAIADARAVRETALANAKMALEEAFTPQLQSMLSAKLAEEDDEEEVHVEPEVEAMHDDETDDEGMHKEGSYMEDDEIPGEEEVPMEPEMEGSYMEDDEIPGDEEVPVEEMEPEEEDELDLEAIVRQLESEINEEDDAYPDNVEGDKDSDHIEDMAEQLAKTQSELDEYKAAVTFLKDKIHEVNILNAKLLFTNKLFKEYALDNGQKLRVVETFDRAQTTREIKLVYSTLAENFGDSKPVRKTKITESASRKTGSTKPSKEARKVISEEAQVADRFRKLAGLNKSN